MQFASHLGKELVGRDRFHALINILNASVDFRDPLVTEGRILLLQQMNNQLFTLVQRQSHRIGGSLRK